MAVHPSPLETARLAYEPKIPDVLRGATVGVVEEPPPPPGPDAGAIGGPFTWEELNMNPGTKVLRNDIAGMSNSIASGIVKNVYPGKQIKRGPLVATLPLNRIDNRIDRPANGYNTFDWGPVDLPDEFSLSLAEFTADVQLDLGRHLGVAPPEPALCQFAQILVGRGESLEANPIAIWFYP